MYKAAKLIRTIRGNQTAGGVAYRIGTIPSSYTSGYPTILFDGEATASAMTYNYVASYTPAANDRVLLAPVGHGYVIVGKIV